MFTWHGRDFADHERRERTFYTCFLIMLVAGVVSHALVMAPVNAIQGKEYTSPATETAITYKGQAFYDFQPVGEVNFYGIAEKVRGKPLPAPSEMWKVDHRNEVIVNHQRYGKCKPEEPATEYGVRYKALDCELLRDGHPLG